MGYLRENSLNGEVNQNPGEGLNLAVTESIHIEAQAVRGCALNGRCLEREKYRNSSKKVRTALGAVSVRGWEDAEGVCGGRREGMIEEGGGELGSCRLMQSRGGEGFKE